MELRIKNRQTLISLWLNGNNGNIILASGLPQYIDKYHPFVKQAERLGLNLFVPKYMGTYESEGGFSLKNSIRTIDETIKLVKSGGAYELYAKKRVSWSADNTTLFGFSYGALPSLLQREEIRKIMVCPFLFPRLHMSEGCAGENIVKTLEFLKIAYKNIYRINLKYFLKELANLKIHNTTEKMTFLYGKDDSSIPITEIDKIKQYYKNSDVILKNGGHSINVDDNTMIRLCNVKKIVTALVIL